MLDIYAEQTACHCSTGLSHTMVWQNGVNLCMSSSLLCHERNVFLSASIIVCPADEQTMEAHHF